MKRGQIRYIENPNNDGRQQRGDRPAVIISNQKQIDTSDTVQIVYMTTQPKTDLPTHFLTRNALSPSTVLCENIYSVPKYRVKEHIGTLSEQEMQQLNICLSIGVGINLSLASEKTQDEKTLEEFAKATERSQKLEEALAKANHQIHVYKDLYEGLLEKVLQA